MIQILIPQYNETDEMIKNMFDSIEIQQNIDVKNDVEVIVGNDGSETRLSNDLFSKYSFHIQYYLFEHSGVAGCRQKLLELATADYIMFLDADDMFVNNVALSMISNEIKGKPDLIISDFISDEHIDDIIDYVLYSEEYTHVHGKVYNRNFLLANEIKWHAELGPNQDSAFNAVVATLSKNTKMMKTPTLLWKWNPDSITRKDGIIHALRTHPNMIDSYDVIVNELNCRGFGNYARHHALCCLYATYYVVHFCEWDQYEEAVSLKQKVYERLVRFFKDHRMLLMYARDEKEIEKVSQRNKELYGNKGTIKENIPSMEEWLEKVLDVYEAR